MRPLRCLALVLRAVAQRVCNSDPLDDEDLLLQVYLALGRCGQSPLARIDAARLQRAPKSAGESTCGRGDYIVERGRVLGVLARRRSIVLTHRTMRAEDHRLVFGRKERLANRSALADDPHP